MSTWQPSPAPGQQDPRRVGELLDRTTRRLGGPSSRTTSAVFSGWDDLVGPDIAAHSRPVSLHDGILVLAVDHPAWATQLRYMTAQLLTQLATVTTGSEITDIRIRVEGQPASEASSRRGGKPGL